jgi:hypothetical protein
VGLREALERVGENVRRIVDELLHDCNLHVEMG